MKKDENSLFPDIKGPAPNKTRKILEEEYHKARQQRLLGKRKEKGEENNLEQPKEASLEEELQKPEKDLHDYTVYFEINSSHKEQIKKIAAFIDSIKDRKASWSEMNSLRGRMLNLVLTTFSKDRLKAVDLKNNDYTDKKISVIRYHQAKKDYNFFLKKILKQFFNASINNDPGTTGWPGVGKITLIKGFQKLVKKIN